MKTITSSYQLETHFYLWKTLRACLKLMSLLVFRFITSAISNTFKERIRGEDTSTINGPLER